MANRPRIPVRRSPARRPQAARRSSLGAMKWLLLITIVIVLAKVAVPPVTKAILAKQLEEPIDKTAIKSLETAINAYRLQVYQLPVSADWKDEHEPHPTRGEWFEALLGVKNTLNTDGSTYLSLPSAPSRRGGVYKDARGAQHLTDQFGRPFQVLFDLDGDGWIANPDPGAAEEKKSIPGSVLIYSLGADGKKETWKDNLTSW